MFASKTLLNSLLALALVSSSGLGVAAQATASDADVEAVVDAYTSASIIAPSASSTDTYQLPSLPALEGTLNAYYADGSIEVELGTLITQANVSTYPNLSVSPLSNATAFTSGALFTVILADYDANTTELDAAGGQTRHWLVNSATVDTTTSPYNLTYASSTAITSYTGPGPYAYTGAHKYVLLVIAQPSTFTAPANLSTAGTALGVFDVNEYISGSGLGDVVATNYFTVDNDPDQAAVVSTTASGAATSTSTASATGATTGSATGSATSGTSTAAATTSAAASSAIGSARVGLWTGIVGLVGAASVALVGTLAL